jgi:hypothetical protein
MTYTERLIWEQMLEHDEVASFIGKLFIQHQDEITQDQQHLNWLKKFIAECDEIQELKKHNANYEKGRKKKQKIETQQVENRRDIETINRKYIEEFERAQKAKQAKELVNHPQDYEQ